MSYQKMFKSPDRYVSHQSGLMAEFHRFANWPSRLRHRQVEVELEYRHPLKQELLFLTIITVLLVGLFLAFSLYVPALHHDGIIWSSNICKVIR